MAINPLLNGSVSFSNIAATTAAFTLRGGVYNITIISTGFGTVTLQRLAPDNATYVTCLTAFAAAGYATVQLPPGTYKVAIGTTTAVYIDIIAIATDL